MTLLPHVPCWPARRAPHLPCHLCLAAACHNCSGWQVRQHDRHRLGRQDALALGLQVRVANEGQLWRQYALSVGQQIRGANAPNLPLAPSLRATTHWLPRGKCPLAGRGCAPRPFMDTRTRATPSPSSRPANKSSPPTPTARYASGTRARSPRSSASPPRRYDLVLPRPSTPHARSHTISSDLVRSRPISSEHALS